MGARRVRAAVRRGVRLGRERGELAGVEAGFAQAEIAKARTEFAAAQAALEKAPEDTPQIREELQMADLQWGFFDAALRGLTPGAPDPVSMSNVFTTSERILEVMDGVTGRFAKLG